MTHGISALIVQIIRPQIMKLIQLRQRLVKNAMSASQKRRQEIVNNEPPTSRRTHLSFSISFRSNDQRVGFPLKEKRLRAGEGSITMIEN